MFVKDEKNEKDEKDEKDNNVVSNYFAGVMGVFALATLIQLYKTPSAMNKVHELLSDHTFLVKLGVMIASLCFIRFSYLWKQERWRKAAMAGINAFIIAVFASVDFVIAPFWFILFTMYFVGEV